MLLEKCVIYTGFIDTGRMLTNACSAEKREDDTVLAFHSSCVCGKMSSLAAQGDFFPVHVLTSS